MIDKQDVIAFFDRCASDWDAQLIRDDRIINTILDNAGIKADGGTYGKQDDKADRTAEDRAGGSTVGPAGMDVLDVACGTGVLFPYYLERGVRSVTGIDISPEMAKIASGKYQDPRIRVICGDVEETCFDRKFDAVVVYNAFPHFPDPQRLIQALAALTKTGGRLTVAHGMSRSRIDSHHKGGAQHVSNGLIHEEELKKLFASYFHVDIVISDDRMYQVSGIRRRA